ncbi:hypothetical protein [Phytoactinopolyspora endophytica]|uniref:hypothetical protein n=1 Tax=Phytoactinopolyspora endophytica TaxID=1642495 RepID=UPI00101DE869|nr:hypothetical protein [Phytoactinopolyspora endophytica]
MNRTATMTSLLGTATLALVLAACGSDDGANPFAGVDNAEGDTESQTTGDATEGQDSDDAAQAEDTEQGSEAEASDEYCDRAEPFADDVLVASTFSTYDQGSSVSDQLHEIADLAPNQDISDDWRKLAQAIGLLSLEDMSDPVELENILFELSVNDSTLHGDLDKIPGRLTSHLQSACENSGSQTDSEPDEQEPEQDPEEELEAGPAGDYCDMVTQFNDTTTSNSGAPSPDLLGEYASTATEIAAAAPDEAIAADWNAMADFFEAAADVVDDPYALEELQEEWDFDQTGQRLDEHALSECT